MIMDLLLFTIKVKLNLSVNVIRTSNYKSQTAERFTGLNGPSTEPGRFVGVSKVRNHLGLGYWDLFLSLKREMILSFLMFDV